MEDYLEEILQFHKFQMPQCLGCHHLKAEHIQVVFCSTKCPGSERGTECEPEDFKIHLRPNAVIYIDIIVSCSWLSLATRVDSGIFRFRNWKGEMKHNQGLEVSCLQLEEATKVGNRTSSFLFPRRPFAAKYLRRGLQLELGNCQILKVPQQAVTCVLHVHHLKLSHT